MIHYQIWQGPLDSDWDSPGRTRLKQPVPMDRWPYGPPAAHEPHCHLFDNGLYCDCVASDTSDDVQTQGRRAAGWGAYA